MLENLSASIIEKIGQAIYDRLKKEQLSDVEGHILVSAAKHDGYIVIMKIDQPPYDFIRASNELLYDTTAETRVVIQYKDAIRSLIAKGYLAQENVKAYRITDKGYIKADRIIKK